MRKPGRNHQLARRFAALAFVVSMTTSVLGAETEKIEISGSKPQIDRPKRDQRPERRGPGIEIRGERPTTEGGFTAPTPNIPFVPSRRQREELDRQKNWIFVNPYELDRRAAGLDKIEREDEHPFMDSMREEKSVMEQFFEEKSRFSREEARERNRPDDPGFQRLSREGNNPFDPLGNRRNWDRDEGDADDNAFRRDLSLKSFFGGDRDAENNPAERPSGAERYGFDLKSFANRPELSSAQRKEMKREEELRSAEFQKLLQPRNMTPSIGGVVDPLNTQFDPGRQEYNPIAPRRTDSFGGLNRNEGSGIAASPKRPSAAADSRTPASFEAFSTITLPKSPVSAPSFTSPVQSAAPASVPAPFAFEVPRRAF